MLLNLFYSNFILSKLEFGFYKSHIYGLFTPYFDSDYTYFSFFKRFFNFLFGFWWFFWIMKTFSTTLKDKKDSQIKLRKYKTAELVKILSHNSML